eukprot:g6574.t1
MADLMTLDKTSGRLVRKSTYGYDAKNEVGAGGGGGGTGGQDGSPSPAKVPKRKPRSAARSSGDHMSGSPIGAGAGAGPASPERFEVFVAKEDFKFSSSHFVAFDGFRERLHGHNYSASIRLRGQVCEDGYVVDFGVVKKVMRKLCKELNERFLCPMESDALEISLTNTQAVIVCQDGATFVLPVGDCALLPLVHSTAEELAHYLFTRLLKEFGLHYLHSRGVTDMDVSVAELPRQEATYRGRIPRSEDKIQEPPFRSAKRVQGCFSRNADNDGCNVSFSSGGGGGGGEMDSSSGNNIDMGVNELSPNTDGAGFLGLAAHNRLRQHATSPFGASELSGGGGSSSGGWNLSGGGGGGGRALSLGSPPSSGVMTGRVHLGGAGPGGGGGGGGVGMLSGAGGGSGVLGGGGGECMLSGLRSNGGMGGMPGTSQGFGSQGGGGGGDSGGGSGGGGVLGLGQGMPTPATSGL